MAWRAAWRDGWRVEGAWRAHRGEGAWRESAWMGMRSRVGRVEKSAWREGCLMEEGAWRARGGRVEGA